MSESIDTIRAAAAAMLADLALSPETKRTYYWGAMAFMRFLGDIHGPEPHPISVIDEDTLTGFMRWLREHYPDPRAQPGEDLGESRTARSYITSATLLMNWLDLHELLPEGVSYDRMRRRARGARGQRRQGYAPRRVDPEVMCVLEHYLRRPLPRNLSFRLTLLRNRALIAVLYDTAARVAEILSLTRADVLDGRAERVVLVRTKNGKPRTVFLSADTRDLIGDYIRERGMRSSIDNARAPLFPSHLRQRQGGNERLAPLTGAAVRGIVKRAAVAEGLFDNTSPHCFRHRRAQDLLNNGMPLEWVAAYLGHERPDTTRIIYAWETDVNRLGDMIAQYGKSPLEVMGKNQHKAE